MVVFRVVGSVQGRGALQGTLASFGPVSFFYFVSFDFTLEGPSMDKGDFG